MDRWREYFQGITVVDNSETLTIEKPRRFCRNDYFRIRGQRSHSKVKVR